MKLDDKEIAIVRSILAATIPEFEVRAFGSRVHGRGLKPFSDIDLAIMATAPVASDRLCELKEQFAESDLPYKVDVVDYAAASPRFREIIQQEYEVIYRPQQ
jgi:type I restriction enzyme S subunit